jgi:outer membrane immunogenic protein
MMGDASMKKRFWLYATVASAALLIASAVAAPAQAQMAKPFNWTGVYVGVNGGFGFGPEKWRFQGIGGGTANQSLTGGTFGGTLGWNFAQIGPYVFGVEGDYGWSGISGNTPCPNTAYGCSGKLSNFGTLRGRAGYAVIDRLLVFGTAGFGGGSVQPNYNPNPGAVTVSQKTMWGWTIGGGAEYAFHDMWNGAWIGKIEYLYTDLGNNTFTEPGQPINTKTRVNLIRGGVEFKF